MGGLFSLFDQCVSDGMPSCKRSVMTFTMVFIDSEMLLKAGNCLLSGKSNQVIYAGVLSPEEEDSSELPCFQKEMKRKMKRQTETKRKKDNKLGALKCLCNKNISSLLTGHPIQPSQKVQLQESGFSRIFSTRISRIYSPRSYLNHAPQFNWMINEVESR